MQKKEYRYCSKWLQVLWLMLLAFAPLSCERTQHHQQLTLKQRSVLPEKQSIATVNNDEIDLEQFNRVYRWHAKSIVRLSQPSRTEIEKALNTKRLIASQLIDKYLLEKEAARRNIKITEEDIQNSRQKIVDSFPDATIYNKYIAELPGGEENLRYMLQMRSLREKIAAAIGATDIGIKEAQAYYDRNKQIYNKPKSYTIQEIFVRFPVGANEAVKKQLRNKTKKILTQVTTKKLPFAVAVDRYSDAAQARSGGFRGGLISTNTEAGVWKAITRLKVNEVSNLVETTKGYHIIKLIRSNPAQTKKFSAVKTQIMTMLRSRQLSANVTAMVIDLRSKANIQNHLAQRYQSLTAHSLAKRSTAIGNRRPLDVKAMPSNKSAKTL